MRTKPKVVALAGHRAQYDRRVPSPPRGEIHAQVEVKVLAVKGWRPWRRSAQVIASTHKDTTGPVWLNVGDKMNVTLHVKLDA